MNMGIDSEGLFAIYADWIAFLREKRTTFEGQIAKVQGKESLGKEVPNQASAPSPASPNGQSPQTTALPEAPLVTPSRPPEKKSETLHTPLARINLAALVEHPSLPEEEREPGCEEKEEDLPAWLWQADRVLSEAEATSSSLFDEEEEPDEWM